MRCTRMLTLVAVLFAVLRAPAVAAAQVVDIDPQLTPAEEPLDGAAERGVGADGGVDEEAPPEPGAVPPPPAVDPVALRLEELEQRFEAGVVAWRRGAYEVAEARWSALLDELERRPTPVHGRERIVDRHALLHDLGNAAYRLDRPLEAVGWYLAALRHAPRDPQTRANLALARREAGLEPERDPDFVGSLLDSLALFTPAESRWLALLGLLPLLTGLLGEAIRGGRAWRGLALLGCLAALAGAAPLVHHTYLAPEDPVLVVRPTRVEYRAEPLGERPAIGALEPGAIVERIDALPDWVRIETDDGTRGWLPEEHVFALAR